MEHVEGTTLSKSKGVEVYNVSSKHEKHRSAAFPLTRMFMKFNNNNKNKKKKKNEKSGICPGNFHIMDLK